MTKTARFSSAMPPGGLPSSTLPARFPSSTPPVRLPSSTPPASGPRFDSVVKASRVRQLQHQLRERIKESDSLELVAQRFTNIAYTELAQSLVLVRVYATIPLEKLPPEIEAHVYKWS